MTERSHPTSPEAVCKLLIKGKEVVLEFRPSLSHRHLSISALLLIVVLFTVPLDIVYNATFLGGVSAYLMQWAICLAGFYAGAIGLRQQLASIDRPTMMVRFVYALRTPISYGGFTARVTLLCAFEAMSILLIVSSLRQHPGIDLPWFWATFAVLVAIHCIWESPRLGTRAWSFREAVESPATRL